MASNLLEMAFHLEAMASTKSPTFNAEVCLLGRALLCVQHIAIVCAVAAPEWRETSAARPQADGSVCPWQVGPIKTQPVQRNAIGTELYRLQ